MTKVDLKLDWCSHEAAKYAVEKWHYSRSMPAGKIVKIGVWENEKFTGCVIFGRGSNKHIGTPYNLSQTQCIELVRVALSKHTVSVSRIISIACKLVKKQSFGLRLIISFADPNQDHVGTIYQAANWLYIGRGTDDPRSRPYISKSGQVQHWRAVAGMLSSRGLSSTIEAAKSIGYLPLETEPKHKYLLPLDDAMRKQIAPLAKPYPKRQHADEATESAAGVQPDNGGATPTRSLETKLAE